MEKLLNSIKCVLNTRSNTFTSYAQGIDYNNRQ